MASKNVKGVIGEVASFSLHPQGGETGLESELPANGQ